MSQPNIILITTDAHRAECYGFETASISTPHIDLLAMRGTRFSACMTPNILCQPARASILTGLTPVRAGVYDNGVDLTDQKADLGFASALKKSGYSTTFIGKAHFESRRTFVDTGSPGNLSYPCRYDEDWTGPYKGFDRAELAVNGHMLHPPGKPPIGRHFEHWYYDGGDGETKNALLYKKLDPQTEAPLTWNSALPPAWHSTTWTADRAIEAITNRKNSDPMCMWVSFPDPHMPFDAPAPWCWSHSPEDVRMPPSPRLSLDGKPWWHAAAAAHPERIYDDARMPDDKQKASFQRLAPSSELHIREMLANYYGSISLIDHNIGRILNALETAGITDDTYIVITSDHGFMMGDHGWLLQNPLSYEGLTRVGLVMAGPDIQENHLVSEPVSTVDLCPTFLDWAQATPQTAYSGASLAMLAKGEDSPRDYAIGEWNIEKQRYCLGRDLDLRTVRAGRFKFAYDLNSEVGELYDLVDDPDETINRFEDPEFSTHRAELIDMVRAHEELNIGATGDRVGYY